MKDDGNRWKLGLFVLLGVGIAVFALIWLGAVGFDREKLSTVTYFDESVQGLDVGSPVKFRGVPIGSVTEIGVAPDQRHVEVWMQLDVRVLRRIGLREQASPRIALDGTAVPREVRVQLASAGITGLKYIELNFFPSGASMIALPFVPPENYFPSTESTLKGLEDTVNELARALPELTEGAGGALREATATLEALRKTLLPLVDEDGAVIDLLRQFEVTAASLEAAANAAEVGQTARAMRQAADSVGALSADVSDVAEELREDLIAFRETLDAIRALAEYLERDPSALLRGRSVPAEEGGR